MIGLVILFIILLIVIIIRYTLTITHITNTQPISSIKQRLQPGDIILYSSEAKTWKESFNQWMARIYLGSEFSHIGIVVFIHGIPYVWDTSPFFKEYHSSIRHSNSSRKESGFSKWDDVVRSHKGYLAIRHMKKPLDNEKLWHWTKELSKQTYYHASFLSIIKSRLFPGEILYHVNDDQSLTLKNQTTYINCCEGVTLILKLMNIDLHAERGAMFEPFLRIPSPIFGPIIHLVD